MKYEVLSKTIRDIAVSVKHTGKLTIFNGAGISKAAGIPLAGEIVQRLARDLFAKAGQPVGDDLEKWLQRQPFYDHNKPYASLLDAAYPNRIERSKFFQSLITGKSPTKAHLAIAELMKKGIVNGVLTTNFDSLMEYAVVQICNRVPCTVLFDKLPEFLRKDSLRPKVLKLHGDYLFGNIQNLERELSLVQNSMREKLRLYAYAETLVIAGYSGGDNSVMQAFEELAADPAAFPGGIFWLYLQNHTPSSTVIDLLEKTSAKGSGGVAIADCDSFFTELVSLLDTPAQNALKPLVNDAYKVIITKDERLKFIKANLDQNDATEFTLQLQRKPELEEFTNTPMVLDYLIARYEEDAEIPMNQGELIGRYVDLLAASFRIKQLAGLDTGNKNSLLRHYLAALQLKNDGLDLENIEKYINENGLYHILCMYVGLFEDATDIISAAFNKVKLLGDLPAFIYHGRMRPWPEQFHIVAQLIGYSAYVDRQLIEMICDYLLLEFDKEYWLPNHAIATLASMGNTVITQLLEYMFDPLQETFSREDAALVLGRIGNRRVIQAIADVADNITKSREAKMLVYALGETGNPHAFNAIKSLAPKISYQSEFVLKNALSGIGYPDEPVSTGLHAEEPTLRVEIGINEILDEFVPAVKRDAMSISMLVSLGIKLDQENKFWEAERIFIECLESLPTIAGFYHNLALVYSRQGRLLAARRYYALGLALNPDYSDYFNDFGVLMKKLQNYEAAYFLYVNAIARDKEWKNHRPWFNLADLYITEAYLDDSGAVDTTNEAQDSIRHTSKITSDSHKPIDISRLRDAKTCLRWVLTLQPNHQRAKVELHSLDFIDSDTTDKPPDSSELFMALHSHELKRSSTIRPPSGMPKDITEQLQQAGEYYMKAEFKKSLEYLLKAWEQWPKSSIIASNLALMYVQLGERSKAIDISKEAIAIWPHQDVDLYLILSNSLLEEKRVAEAIRIADEAVQIAPNDSLTWYSLGNALAASGKKGEAVNAYRQSIRFAKPWSFLDAKARDAITDLFGGQYR